MRAPLEIRLLGELEVWRAGQHMALPASKRTRALLAYLVATGKAHRREHLCELLWQGPDDPRASLRWSLSKIRPLLDAEGHRRLVADREHVAVEVAAAEVDWPSLRGEIGAEPARASLEALQKAAACFRGELLEGLDLHDCYRYQEWCTALRAEARALRLAVLDALVDRLSDRPEEAVVHARARVAADPLAEEGHVRLLRLLGRLGHHREALAQYEACAGILKRELGTAPSLELEDARRDLSRAAPARRRVETGPVRPGTPPPSQGDQPGGLLFGRAEELARLRERVAEARAGNARGLFLLRGEPGMGKSRLLAELAAEVGRAGGRALAARAFEAERARPYGPWIDALRVIPTEETAAAAGPDLAPLLPELGPSRSDGGDRARLFDAVVGLLRTLGTPGPLAVLLDDLQWFDSSSAALLHYATRALEGTRVLLAAAARPGELADNVDARQLVRALARDGRLVDQALPPLDDAATAELARSVAPRVDAERVRRESRGNPLFALEVARALEGGADALSDSLLGLIGERLERLEGPAGDLLPWAAALGRPFALDTLAQAAGRSSGEVLEAVTELERHRILVLPDSLREGMAEPLYDFAHDLVRTAAYRRLSEPQRRLVHRQIARALDALPDTESALADDVARHAALGQEHLRCARACVRAGERCLRLFAHGEAGRAADLGLSHLEGLPEEDRLPLEVALLRLHVHSRTEPETGRRVEERLREVAREAQAAGRAEVAVAALNALTFVHWYRGDLGAAHQQTLIAADVGRTAPPPSAARALAATGRCLVHLDRDLDRAETLLGDAGRLAAQGGQQLCDVPWGLGMLRLHEGRYEEAVPLLESALLLGRREQDRYPEWDTQVRLAMIELERGRPEAALERCRTLAPLMAQMARDGEGSEPVFTAALQALAGLQSDLPGAAEDLETAIERLRAIDSKWMLAYVLVAAAEHDLAHGAAGRARQRAEEALVAADAVGRHSEATIAAALLAREALGRGDRAGALERLAPRADAQNLVRLSARARATVGAAAGALGLAIPTLAPTPVPTREP